MPSRLLELLDQPVNHALVQIVAAEMGVTISAEHLEGAPAGSRIRDIEDVPPPKS
ncbi:hypothetical protein [Candidatus Amarobacter glycogenicus]|uniref:hypothetical protein n=1 Tax=Candidatus Amarobacter glycogenicus TaxID=3140699 RepID=UPI0031CC85DD